MEISVLYEDSELLVVIKPSGMPSQPDKTGDTDLLSFLENKYSKSLYLVHRLDRPVGGVMLFAKTKECAAFFSKNEKSFVKEYAAVLTGKLENQLGTLEHYLLKNGKTNTSVVVSEKTKGAKKAILEYEVKKELPHETYGTLTYVKVNLLTGRHHQIRVQFSSIGAGIWGDKKYNTMFLKGGLTQIALWSAKLCFLHPNTKQWMAFENVPHHEPFTLFTN